MLSSRALLLSYFSSFTRSMACTSNNKLYTEPASDDSFSNIPDAFDLTEEDFAQLDAQTAETFASTSALPALPIALEEPVSQKTTSPPPPVSKKPSWTPLSKFRWHGRLSVTDLAGPAWCEYQFEYGLLGKRYLSLDKRPSSFKSRDGVEIKLTKEVAAQNDVVLLKGKTIHKKLELQVRPEAVPVRTRSEEEAWALRLVNFISCLRSLVATNMTREIPVFGLIQGQVVSGVIDELTCHESRKRTAASPPPSTPRKSKKPKPEDASPTRQAQLDAFLVKTPASPSPSTTRPSTPPPSQSPHYTIRISDSKTRQISSIPDDDDALPARVQLMVYHRMLAPLVSVDSVRPALMSLWKALHLNVFDTFSDDFIAQTTPILEQEASDTPIVRNLTELAELLQVVLLQLGTFDVDSTLKIVYRRQTAAGFKKSKKGKGKEKQTVMDVISASDDAALAMAIQASLLDAGVPEERKGEASAVLLKELEKAAAVSDSPKALEVVSGVNVASSSSTASPPVDSSLLAAQEAEALLARLAPDSNVPAGEETEVEETDTETETTVKEDEKKSRPTLQTEASIIGVKTFEMDNKFLDNFLDDMLAWWYGRRRPRGVEMGLTRRCSNCEYMQSCEWREQKSVEVEEARKARPSQKQRKAAFEARRLAEQSKMK